MDDLCLVGIHSSGRWDQRKRLVGRASYHEGRLQGRSRYVAVGRRRQALVLVGTGTMDAGQLAIFGIRRRPTRKSRSMTSSTPKTIRASQSGAAESGIVLYREGFDRAGASTMENMMREVEGAMMHI